jgi:hypothetical protein
MNRASILLGLAATLAACGTVQAESGAGSRSFDVRGFDRVSLRGSDNVVVRVGSAESVTAAGPKDVLDRLEVVVVDGELRIGRQKQWSTGWSSDGKAAVITVTLPRLRGAAVAGSGDMQVDRAQAVSFSGSVAGSGNLVIGTLQADAASISIAGSGDANLTGQARSLDISIAGSGNLNGAGLRSERAKINVAGSGNVEAYAAAEADVSIVGSGDVTLAGKAKCRVSKMGSGEVRCGG